MIFERRPEIGRGVFSENISISSRNSFPVKKMPPGRI
jgi:hypothetical protein